MKLSRTFAVVILIVWRLSLSAQSKKVAMGNMEFLSAPNSTLFYSSADVICSFEGMTADFITYDAWWSMGSVGSNVHSSMSTEIGRELWAGPIDTLTLTAKDPADWNKVWVIEKHQVDAHISNYRNSDYRIPTEISSWPAAHEGENIKNFLAPYVDWNENGVYDPENGDYPYFPGDICAYTISNDQFGEHLNSGGNKIVLEQLSMLYAYNEKEFKNIIFGKTFFINRSVNDYAPFYLGKYLNFGLGNAADNRMATDVGSNLIYGYNGDADDEGLNAFGLHLPAAGFTFLNKELYSSCAFTLGDSIRGMPNNTSELVNVMNGLWKNGGKKVMQGKGTGTGSATNFIYPGDTDPLNGSMDWTDESSGEGPGMKNGLGVLKFAELKSKGSLEIDYAYVFDTGMLSQNRIPALALQAKNRYRTTLDIANSEVDLSSLCYPNPLNVRDILTISECVSRVIIYDVLGRECYRINREELIDKNFHISRNEFDSRGVLFINLETNRGWSQQKLIVK